MVHLMHLILCYGSSNEDKAWSVAWNISWAAHREASDICSPLLQHWSQWYCICFCNSCMDSIHFAYEHLILFFNSKFPNTLLADNWTAYKSCLIKQLYWVFRLVCLGPYLILENEIYCSSHYVVNASKLCLRELGYPRKSPFILQLFSCLHFVIFWVLLMKPGKQ